MNKYLTMALIALGLVGGGYAFGRYAQPAKVVTQIKEKEVLVEKIKKDVITVVKEIVKKDGTKETTTTITDKTSSESEKEKTSDSKTVVQNQRPQWKVQGIVGVVDLKLANPIYGAGVERRIIGPISAGVYGKTNNEFGLTVSMEF